MCELWTAHFLWLSVGQCHFHIPVAAALSWLHNFRDHLVSDLADYTPTGNVLSVTALAFAISGTVWAGEVAPSTNCRMWTCHLSQHHLRKLRKTLPRRQNFDSMHELIFFLVSLQLTYCTCGTILNEPHCGCTADCQNHMTAWEEPESKVFLTCNLMNNDCKNIPRLPSSKVVQAHNNGQIWILAGRVQEGVCSWLSNNEVPVELGCLSQMSFWLLGMGLMAVAKSYCVRAAKRKLCKCQCLYGPTTTACKVAATSFVMVPSRAAPFAALRRATSHVSDCLPVQWISTGLSLHQRVTCNPEQCYPVPVNHHSPLSASTSFNHCGIQSSKCQNQ